MQHTEQTNHARPAPEPPLRTLPDQTAEWRPCGANPLSWDEARQAIAEADAKDGARTDIGVGDLSSWVLGPGPGGVASLVAVPVPGRPRSAPVPMRRAAFGQLAEAIGAPSAYLLKLPARTAVACIAHGMQQIPQRQAARLLRMARGEVRAVASDSYAPLDNELVMDTLESTLRAQGILRDVRVTDLSLGPTTGMRLTLPSRDKAVRVGDVVALGLDVLNGEILNRSLSITPATYRLVCLNGMRSADVQGIRRFRHVGDPRRLAEAFADAVPVALAEAEGLRTRMARAVDVLVDDILADIDGLDAFGLTQTDADAAARDLFSERGVALPEDRSEWGALPEVHEARVSVWDVANAITHSAQRHTREVIDVTTGERSQLPGTDRRLALESAAGAYLMRRTR